MNCAHQYYRATYHRSGGETCYVCKSCSAEWSTYTDRRSGRWESPQVVSYRARTPDYVRQAADRAMEGKS